MALTDGAKGNLQSSLATKKGIDQLNNKIARMSELDAKKMIMEAEDVEEEEAKEQIRIETKKNEKTNRGINNRSRKIRANKGYGW